MPVGLGEIEPRTEALLSKGLAHEFHRIGARVCMKGHFIGSDFIVGLLGIPHAESVVMLGHREDIFDARILKCSRPLVWIKFGGVERGGEIFVNLLVTAVVEVSVLRWTTVPGHPRTDEAPRLDNPPLAVCSPVKQNPKLAVLPSFEILYHCGVRRRSPFSAGF